MKQSSKSGIQRRMKLIAQECGTLPSLYYADDGRLKP
jgi:hypothetical protein